MCAPLTGDLLSSLVGREVVYVCSPDRRLVIESCRQGSCMCARVRGVARIVV